MLIFSTDYGRKGRVLLTRTTSVSPNKGRRRRLFARNHHSIRSLPTQHLYVMTRPVCSNNILPFTYNYVIIIMHTSKPLLYYRWQHSKHTTNGLSWRVGKVRKGRVVGMWGITKLRDSVIRKYKNMNFKNAFGSQGTTRQNCYTWHFIIWSCFHTEYKSLQFIRNANHHVIICEYACTRE
jgi:hypothetical protein